MQHWDILTLMSWLRQLHPRRLFEALDAIDTDAESSASYTPRNKLSVALCTVAVCLLLIHYLKFSSTFTEFVQWLSVVFTEMPATYLLILKNSGFLGIISQLWWLLWHVIGYVLIPIIVIKAVYREQLSDYGLRWAQTSHYLPWCALLATPIIFFAFLASFNEEFTNQYPFYGLAHRSWADLILWEAIYVTQFACLEFFFRGFLLHACFPACRANAVFIMVVPYTMIHFAKPWPEATGAIFFGFFLAIIALRSRSIWGGVFVHAAIALSMDIFALVQTNRIPTTLWFP